MSLGLLIVNSSNTSTHESVKNNLLEAFIAKRDEYPTTRSEAIALLNKYDERKPPPTAGSEGTAFAQTKGKKKSEDKKKEDEKDKDGEEKPTKKTSSKTENASYATRRVIRQQSVHPRKRTKTPTTRQYPASRIKLTTWKRR